MNYIQEMQKMAASGKGSGEMFARANAIEIEMYAAHGGKVSSLLPRDVSRIAEIDAQHPEIQATLTAVYAEAKKIDQRRLDSLPCIERMGPDGVCDLYAHSGEKIH